MCISYFCIWGLITVMLQNSSPEDGVITILRNVAKHTSNFSITFRKKKTSVFRRTAVRTSYQGFWINFLCGVYFKFCLSFSFSSTMYYQPPRLPGYQGWRSNHKLQMSLRSKNVISATFKCNVILWNIKEKFHIYT